MLKCSAPMWYLGAGAAVCCTCRVINPVQNKINSLKRDFFSFSYTFKAIELSECFVLVGWFCVVCVCLFGFCYIFSDCIF